MKLRTIDGPGKTYVTVVDRFLVSPNLQIESVDVIPLNFKDSGREPVSILIAAY